MIAKGVHRARLEDRLLKPEEAAGLLGVSLREAQSLCQRRLLRHEVSRSPGGRLRYFIPESAILEFRDRRMVEVEPWRGRR